MQYAIVDRFGQTGRFTFATDDAARVMWRRIGGQKPPLVRVEPDGREVAMTERVHEGHVLLHPSNVAAPSEVAP
jgi:hypothetical protein